MGRKSWLAVFAYFFGIMGGVIVYLTVRKKEKFLRFHAAQSILFNIFACLLWIVIAILMLPPNLAGSAWVFFPAQSLVAAVYSTIMFVIWIVLIVQAYHNRKYKLPAIGDWAEQWTR